MGTILWRRLERFELPKFVNYPNTKRFGCIGLLIWIEFVCCEHLNILCLQNTKDSKFQWFNRGLKSPDETSTENSMLVEISRKMTSAAPCRDKLG